MQYVWGRRKRHTRFWRRNPNKRGHFEDLDIHGQTILNWIFKQWDGRAWIAIISPGIRTSGGLL
jgi:hypothetical protein